MKKLRGVAVGAGYFSQFHYEAWQRLAEAEITALSDLDSNKAANARDNYGIPRIYEDYSEMLDREKPDFVDVITPPHTHREICAEAARRGIHIICQKPLAPSFDEARHIAAATSDAGVRFMVHENFRFQPWYRQIRQQLAGGAIGEKLYSVTMRTRMGDGWGVNAYIPRQPYFREYPRLLIYETGVHFIDTFRYLAGEITRVTAWLRRLNSLIRGEDCGLMVLEFAGGAIGQWDANRYNEPNYPNARYTFGELLLEGDGGSIRLYPDGRLTLQRLGEQEEDISYRHENRGFAGDCVLATQQHFIECLLEGKEFETNGRDYLRTLAVQEAVYLSAKLQSPVDVSY